LIHVKLVIALLALGLIALDRHFPPAPRLRGSISYTLGTSSVELEIGKILNLSSTDEVSTLQVALVATSFPHEENCYVLATASLALLDESALSGAASVRLSGALSQPPPGVYYMHMKLEDRRLSEREVDSVTFGSLRRFGQPQT
jgi:hypothetical protein